MHRSRDWSCTDHVTDHALITWLSCTAHVADHAMITQLPCTGHMTDQDRKSTRLNSSHHRISYAVFCLKKKNAGPPPAARRAELRFLDLGRVYRREPCRRAA